MQGGNAALDILATEDLVGVIDDRRRKSLAYEYFDVFFAVAFETWEPLNEQRRQVGSDVIVNMVMRQREMEVDVLVLIVCVSCFNLFD